ncbi:MAG: transglycosylase SLT domain-containing protein [Candidatus Woesearchaeota archaeon]
MYDRNTALKIIEKKGPHFITFNNGKTTTYAHHSLLSKPDSSQIIKGIYDRNGNIAYFVQLDPDSQVTDIFERQPHLIRGQRDNTDSRRGFLALIKDAFQDKVDYTAQVEPNQDPMSRSDFLLGLGLSAVLAASIAVPFLVCNGKAPISRPRAHYDEHICSQKAIEKRPEQPQALETKYNQPEPEPEPVPEQKEPLSLEQKLVDPEFLSTFNYEWAAQFHIRKRDREIFDNIIGREKELQDDGDKYRVVIHGLEDHGQAKAVISEFKKNNLDNVSPRVWYDSSTLTEMINNYSGSGKITVSLLNALIDTESDWDPDKISSAGARGLTQQMPSNVLYRMYCLSMISLDKHNSVVGSNKEIQLAKENRIYQYLVDNHGIDLNDPSTNLAWGIYDFDERIKRFGNIQLAVASYNAGIRAVELNHNSIPANGETPFYVAKVMIKDGADVVTHIVSKGETMFMISKMYGLDLNLLIGLNKIKDVSRIKIGQKIKIPII